MHSTVLLRTRVCRYSGGSQMVTRAANPCLPSGAVRLTGLLRTGVCRYSGGSQMLTGEADPCRPAEQFTLPGFCGQVCAATLAAPTCGLVQQILVSRVELFTLPGCCEQVCAATLAAPKCRQA